MMWRLWRREKPDNGAAEARREAAEGLRQVRRLRPQSEHARDVLSGWIGEALRGGRT